MKFAFVTYIMNGNSYVEGAKVLATSILKTNTKYPIFIFVTPDISESIRADLKKFFDDVFEIDYINHKCIELKTKNMQNIYGNWIEKSFTKLRILEETYLKDYDKLCYLDADQVVLSNIDDLFLLNTPALCYDSEYSNKYLRNGFKNAFTNYKHSETVKWEFLSDNFKSPMIGKTGIIIFKQNNNWFNTCIEILNKSQIYGHKHLFNGFEEQLLAEMFIKLKIDTTNISLMYCWCGGQFQAILPKSNVKIINYYGKEKPWNTDNSIYLDYYIWKYFEKEMLDKYK